MTGDSQSRSMSDGTVRSSSVGAPSLRGALDIAFAVLFALLGAVVLSLQPGLPFVVRGALVLPLLLVVPGYAVVAALFPGAHGTPTGRVVDPTLIERLGLAVGLSIAIVPAVGMVVDAVWSLTLVPVLDGVAAVTIAAGVVALVRRTHLPVSERFRATAALQSVLVGARERPKTQLFLLAAVLLSVVAIGASGVVATTDDGQGVTEFYLTTEGPDGEQVLATNETIGNESVHGLVVHNPDAPRSSYTVVARTGVITASGVSDRQTLGQTTVTAGPDGTARTTYDLDLERDERPLVLTYLLYENEPPAEPTRGQAVRWLRVQIE